MSLKKQASLNANISIEIEDRRIREQILATFPPFECHIFHSFLRRYTALFAFYILFLLKS